jgi:hypothetical protein
MLDIDDVSHRTLTFLPYEGVKFGWPRRKQAISPYPAIEKGADI